MRRQWHVRTTSLSRLARSGSNEIWMTRNTIASTYVLYQSCGRPRVRLKITLSFVLRPIPKAPWLDIVMRKSSVDDVDMLYQDNPANILAISKFDDYISRTLHSTYIKIPCSQKAIGTAVKKAKRKKSKSTPSPKSNTASNEPGKHTQDSNKTGDQSRRRRFQTFGSSPQPNKKRRS